jgi:hypothetical protein
MPKKFTHPKVMLKWVCNTRGALDLVWTPVLDGKQERYICLHLNYETIVMSNSCKMYNSKRFTLLKEDVYSRKDFGLDVLKNAKIPMFERERVYTMKLREKVHLSVNSVCFVHLLLMKDVHL